MVDLTRPPFPDIVKDDIRAIADQLFFNPFYSVGRDLRSELEQHIAAELQGAVTRHRANPENLEKILKDWADPAVNISTSEKH